MLAIVGIISGWLPSSLFWGVREGGICLQYFSRWLWQFGLWALATVALMLRVGYVSFQFGVGVKCRGLAIVVLILGTSFGRSHFGSCLRSSAFFVAGTACILVELATLLCVFGEERLPAIAFV